jgi:LysM repeat protein
MKYFFLLILLACSITVAAQQAKPKTHTVELGNTFYGISKQYGITVDQIKKWNNLTSYSLRAGQVLIVSDPENAFPEVIEEEKVDPEKTVAQPPVQQQAPLEKIAEEKTQPKEVPTKKETIEDLGFSISEIDTATTTKDISGLLPAKTDTTQGNLIFCGGVEEDKPVGISSIFFNNRGQNYVYVFVEQPEMFGVKNLIADLFLKDENGSRTKVATTNYEVKPKWKYTIFKHFITNPGLYEIVVYDANRKKIGDGQVRILP